MSDYCDEPECPACNLQKHMRYLLKAGCPPEDLVPIVVGVLAEVVGDVIEIHCVEVPHETPEGTVH